MVSKRRWRWTWDSSTDEDDDDFYMAEFAEWDIPDEDEAADEASLGAMMS